MGEEEIMSKTAFLKRMGLGFTGQASRVSEGSSTVNPYQTGSANIKPGMPVKLSNGKIETISAAGDVIKGIVLRAFPSQSMSYETGDALGDTAAYKSGAYAPVLERGYVTVDLQRGKPLAGDNVYVRTSASGSLAVGYFEDGNKRTGTATAGGSNTGNGTMSAVVVEDRLALGNYTVKMTSATAFQVTNSSSVVLGTGTVGADYSSGGLAFKITAGSTAFAANDTFTIAVTSDVSGLTQVTNAVFSSDVEEADGVAEIVYRI